MGLSQPGLQELLVAAAEGSRKAHCRWVAINHGTSENGNHHIHIAVSLAGACTHLVFRGFYVVWCALKCNAAPLQCHETSAGSAGTQSSRSNVWPYGTKELSATV